MKRFYVFISVISFVIILLVLLTYLKYSKSIEFAPDIFLNEIIKFTCLTIIWTIILNFHNSTLENKKKKEQYQILIIIPTVKLLSDLNSGSTQNLSKNIHLILHNIATVKLLHNFTAVQLNKLNDLENNLLSEEYNTHITNLDFQINSGLDYKNMDSFGILTNEFKKLIYVL